MSEIAEPDEERVWNPAPDVGQAGTVTLENGQWAYRYKGSADVIIMKMPEGRGPK